MVIFNYSWKDLSDKKEVALQTRSGGCSIYRGKLGRKCRNMGEKVYCGDEWARLALFVEWNEEIHKIKLDEEGRSIRLTQSG